jgi:hypothetical protein
LAQKGNEPTRRPYEPTSAPRLLSDSKKNEGNAMPRPALTPRTPEQRAADLITRKSGATHRAAQAAATVDALLADADGPLPAYAMAHIARARKGNLRSLIALKCLDCSCWQRVEIAECTCTTCPLYPIRPYKGTAHKGAADERDPCRNDEP